MTGFGQTGPDAGRVGYDALIQGLGGLMSITGQDAEHPTKVGVAVADLGTGLYAVVAILAALLERSRSGLGQHIDLALLDTQVAGLANIAMNFLCTGEVPRPLGNAHPTIVPYQSFATADRPLMLAVGSDLHSPACAWPSASPAGPSTPASSPTPRASPTEPSWSRGWSNACPKRHVTSGCRSSPPPPRSSRTARSATSPRWPPTRKSRTAACSSRWTTAAPPV
ncbi:CoA transferase [Nannocystis pusilla]|uniref:CoA transferase n=1 Tax=Nannocystis pusilla TaxID=889268 RepID=A0A9X3EXX8_9BACT|nr:CoA transferase [Nannocystis pusilla]